jgi:hypothetical protein
MIGTMLIKQPFFIGGIDDVEVAKGSAFGAAGLFFGTFLVSALYMIHDQRRVHRNFLLSDSNNDGIERTPNTLSLFSSSSSTTTTTTINPRWNRPTDIHSGYSDNNMISSDEISYSSHSRGGFDSLRRRSSGTTIEYGRVTAIFRDDPVAEPPITQRPLDRPISSSSGGGGGGGSSTGNTNNRQDGGFFT